MRLGRALPSALGAIALAAACPATAGAIPTEQLTCGDVVTHSVRLAGDVRCEFGTDLPGLVIGADHVILDLNGHTVSGQTGVINGAGHDWVTIRDGAVAGFGNAIDLTGARHNRLVDLIVAAGVGTGIFINGGGQIDIADSEVSGRFGIVVSPGSERIRIVGTTVATGFGDAVDLFANDSVVARSTLEGSFAGVFLQGSRNRVVANVVRANDANIVVESGTGNVVARNRALDSDGVPDAGFPPAGDGISVGAAATGTVLLGNEASGNADDGIDVEAAATRLIHNTANGNGDLGIEAVPGVFAVGNRASGNGNPLQCLNVFCRPG